MGVDRMFLPCPGRGPRIIRVIVGDNVSASSRVELNRLVHVSSDVVFNEIFCGSTFQRNSVTILAETVFG